MRAHESAWVLVDGAFEHLLRSPDSGAPESLNGYENWVRFTMETIARCYETFCKRSVIGGPIDVIAIAPP